MRVAEFRAALRAFLSHSEETSRAWELTPQRYLLLLFIKGAPDGSEQMSLKELTERLRVSPNTVTELVARAEEAGLVRRRTAPHDQRVVLLSLTGEGERRLAGALVETEEARAELTEAFDSLVTSFRSATRNH